MGFTTSKLTIIEGKFVKPNDTSSNSHYTISVHSTDLTMSRVTVLNKNGNAILVQNKSKVVLFGTVHRGAINVWSPLSTL